MKIISIFHNLLCKAGIHKWDEFKRVKSILPIIHAKGSEELLNHKDFIPRKGKECLHCKKQQYAVFVSPYIGTLYYDVISGEKINKDRETIYNGQTIKWFVGDIDFAEAKRVGCTTEHETSRTIIDDDGFYWQAWGSCKGHPFQMYAKYNRHRNEIIEPFVFGPKQYSQQRDGSILEEPSPYFNPKIHYLLTKNNS